MLKLTQVHQNTPPTGSFDLEPVELLFALARRTEQAFSVVWLEIGSHPLVRWTGLDHLEQMITAGLRRTDLLVRCGGNESPARYALFCPATAAQGAKEVIRRIWT